MIISASRRTDIPSYYSDWLYRRIKEGYVLVRNPMNFHHLSKISLSPDMVDGIVFWTKNPIPMLDRLDELGKFTYCFQFTITLYGEDIEPNLPSKTNEILPAFKKLVDLIGADRVIWRYDPILLSNKYPTDFHIHAFAKIAEELHGYTSKVVISFIDVHYRGIKSNMKELALLDFPIKIQIELGSELAKIANAYGLAIETCAEKIDLQQFGIGHARCIDDRLFAKILGCPLNLGKDKMQRLECGCVTSIDIGMYNTCLNGCRYCYANHSRDAVAGNVVQHNRLSPLVSGEVGKDDNIYERSVESCRDQTAQMLPYDS